MDGRQEDLALTHAGAVVRRDRAGTAVFLLVRASRPPHEWVLPKGHIEAGETPEQTARRELLEEAGVVGDVVAPIGDAAFEAVGESIRVRYFLMRFVKPGTPTEARETCWCPCEDAERLLSFDSARAIVRRAATMPGTMPGPDG